MNRTTEEAIVLLKKTPKIRLTAQQEIAELEAEIRELKAWADKNEGLMQAQDRVIEAVSKKVTELEAENAKLLGALECSNFSAKRRGEENAELRKILWSAHGNHVRYGDDGEMQCNSCAIDFKRAPTEQLRDSLQMVFAELRKDKERLEEKLRISRNALDFLVDGNCGYHLCGVCGECPACTKADEAIAAMEAKCD